MRRLDIRQCFMADFVSAALGIPLHHLTRKGAELGKIHRRTRAVSRFAARRWCEAKSHSHVELSQCLHLPIKPLHRIGPIPVRPADASAQFSDPESAQPIDGKVESVIFKMEPLANSHPGIEMFERRFRCSV